MRMESNPVPQPYKRGGAQVTAFTGELKREPSRAGPAAGAASSGTTTTLRHRGCCLTSRSTALLYGRIGYAVSRSTRISLDVFTLLDRKASDVDYLYRSRLRGEQPDGVDGIHFHPVEPRSVRLTLAHNF